MTKVHDVETRYPKMCFSAEFNPHTYMHRLNLIHVHVMFV